MTVDPAVTNRLSNAPMLFVRHYRFEGNTVFTDEELSSVTSPFTNRQISSADLEEARRTVTMHYIGHGYVNSGAIIPDQDPANGVILMQITEGRIEGVRLHGNKWLRGSYITNRVSRHVGPPMNMNELKNGLLELRQNPNVTQVNAEIKPGAIPGESMLDLHVLDRHPFRASLEVDNHRPPSVGAEQISLFVSDLNLTGHSDPVEISYGIANSGADGDEWGFSGSDNIAGSYSFPVTRHDTTVTIFGSREDTSIIEEPFSELVIDSETTGYGITIRHPLYKTANREFAVSFGLDRHQNDTTLLGVPWPVSPGATDNGRTIVSALRLSQEWIDRSEDQVIAIRSTINIGLDVLDATDDGIPGNPDSRFFSWVGQAQYVRRLFDTQNRMIFRLTGQWTDERLVALEQLSVGGFETVRGYRENQLVRDRGIMSSLEFRVPVWFNGTGAGVVFLAPFFDFGGAWNVDRSPDPTTIYSTGIGLIIEPHDRISAELYWGHQLNEIEIANDNDIQDLGLHFRVTVSAF
jgi:hemolysin activation/secretion protein